MRHRDLKKEGQILKAIQDRPPRDRRSTWSASSAGQCLRQQQFVYLGVKKVTQPDDKGMNIFTNGDYVHLRHQACGMVAGYISQAEVPLEMPELNLRGTMDAVLVNNQGFEIKSINSRGFSQIKSFGPKHDHIRQVHAYMLASGLTAFRILYENKDTNELKEFLVVRDEKIIEEVRNDLLTLQELTDKHVLAPMLEECERAEGAYRWCPFAPMCRKAVFPGSRPLKINRSK